MNDKAPTVIDLDVTEIVALLLTEGEAGKAGAISLIDESLGIVGPVANILVQQAMNHSERVEAYVLPRDYTGNILHNKKIAEGVLNSGSQTMFERGLLDESGFTNPILKPIAQLLSRQDRIIHNFSVLADYTRNQYVGILAQKYGPKDADQMVPDSPPNGYSYPVVAYNATIVATRGGNVVIAPNDYNSMLYDFQIMPPIPVGRFIEELTVISDQSTQGDVARTFLYETKLPGGHKILASAFSDSGGNLSRAYQNVTDDIMYSELEDDQEEEPGFLIAQNIHSYFETSAKRGEIPIANIEEAGEYLGRLSTVPLAQVRPDIRKAEEDGVIGAVPPQR